MMRSTTILTVLWCAAGVGCGGGGGGAPAADSAPGDGSTTSQDLGGLPVFPADNPWNQDISQAPVDPLSDQYLASIGERIGLHPDFGSYAGYGIPYVVVGADQQMVPIAFDYADESDPGPYPIPSDALIEGGADADGDRHVLVIDRDNRLLYEVYAAYPVDGGWHAGSGAIFDLTSNALRPAGWTSADAAGLPILAGLVRADEVLDRHEITHALRFTVARTQRGYVSPARHFASSDTDPTLPPMGMRVRLKAAYDISGFPEDCQVILRALKKHGMMVADNGSNWYISGAPDARWNDATLHRLGDVTGADFEVIATGAITRD